MPLILEVWYDDFMFVDLLDRHTVEHCEENKCYFEAVFTEKNC